MGDFRRFSRWQSVWWRVFEAMLDDADFEYGTVDSSALTNTLGREKRGLKIGPLAAPALASEVLAARCALPLAAGQPWVARKRMPSVEGLSAEVVVADTAYDADPLRRSGMIKGGDFWDELGPPSTTPRFSDKRDATPA